MRDQASTRHQARADAIANRQSSIDNGRLPRMTELETARRDAVARLCMAQASGFLSVETFEERYALLREATSVATMMGRWPPLKASMILRRTRCSTSPVMARAR